MKLSIPFLSFTLASANGALVVRNDIALPTIDLGFQVHRAISYNEKTKIYNFTNIPYAQPPLGNLRWRAPLPIKGRIEGIQDGSVGKICPQQTPDWMGIGYQFAAAYTANKLPFNYTLAKEIAARSPPPPPDPRMTEDCLVLDVLVPKVVFEAAQVVAEGAPKKAGAPVIAYIHGGGYVIGEKGMLGSPDDLLIATQENDTGGAIFVSLNYRLGAFGFLSGPDVKMDGVANAGLLDQRFALQWIQANIAKFGGDPDNITIMGVSAGGGSVMHQVTAFGGTKPVPFRRAVAESSGFVPTPFDDVQGKICDDFFNILNVTSIIQARNLPSDTLMAANSKQIAAAPYGGFVYSPVLDFGIVPDLPTRLLKKGRYANQTAIFSSYAKHDGILFTDPRVVEDEKYLEQEMKQVFSSFDPDVAKWVRTSLYPPKYGPSKPYVDSLDRAQLIFGEAAFICNQNALLKYASKKKVPAFGYEFAVPPALHGGDQSGYVFGRGQVEGVNAEVASVIQHAIAGFVIDGVPRKAPNSQLVIPAYGKKKQILSLGGNSSQVIRDPAENKRCNWWQRGIFDRL